MVHDFCHDIDNSKSNGAFYTLFQNNIAIQKAVSQITTTGGAASGGKSKNLSFQETTDRNCLSLNKIHYTPRNVPTNPEDFYKTFLRKEASDTELVLVGRISVAAVALLAIYLAYDRDSSILDLVSNAWAGFGAAFGPLVLFSLYWKRMNFAGALSGMIVGAVTVLVWIYGPFTINGESLSSFMYEIVPGFILASIAIVVVSLATSEPSSEITAMFDEVEKEL